jgi:hypothetical protein
MPDWKTEKEVDKMNTEMNSYNKTNEMHFQIYFGIELYIFRTVSLSIIRYMSYRFC